MNTYQSRQTAYPRDDNSDGCSILVVDDERDIVGLLHDLLEEEGYRVQAAFDGDQAIGMLQENKPHLIISDIMMPRVDGRELLRFVDTLSDEPIPKLILMSAAAKPSFDLKIPFIEKPFDIDDLLQLVNSQIGNLPAQ